MVVVVFPDDGLVYGPFTSFEKANEWVKAHEIDKNYYSQVERVYSPNSFGK